MFDLELHEGACEVVIPTLDMIDTIITSPPYNIKKNYHTYKDALSHDDYLSWCDVWISQLKDILKPQGSFFLNIGHKPSHTTLPYDVLDICRKYFVLQNNFIWVKSISIGDESTGHFKPINSKRYVNDLWEHVFHFTHNGNAKLDRLSIGVPYMDKSNIKRWSSKSDLRCRGNVWFIPYETVCSEKIHPAQFPVALPHNCIKISGYDNSSVVLDPFIGVGNTAKACQKLGCKCIGIDVDRFYLDECIKATGQTEMKMF